MSSFSHMLATLVAVISCISAQDTEYADKRYLKAYFDTDPDGPYLEFDSYSSDLIVEGVDNIIKRVCMTGDWLLYEGSSYFGSSYFYPGAIDSCHNLPSVASVSSLRYAGSPIGLDDIYFNLYTGAYYTGAEMTGNADLGNLGSFDLAISSLVISGQSPWTFFTGTQFDGVAICVRPTFLTDNNGVSYHHAYVNLVADLGIPDNSIRSVARGCKSGNVYRGKPRNVQHAEDLQPMEHVGDLQHVEHVGDLQHMEHVGDLQHVEHVKDLQHTEHMGDLKPLTPGN
ncbi:uncharacterized protein LOC108674716 [Hyalella azteca]|uniref:Uncharacterized protein LOC108674716 n=1 Tax=Hyalella azteca TaxID=294128 RepID=A0A8B7NWN4_HYAAZ|nr:uncharacterized protein LOC108674716 [Hyalella azteca]